jgi:hypothetical protein
MLAAKALGFYISPAYSLAAIRTGHQNLKIKLFSLLADTKVTNGEQMRLHTLVFTISTSSCLDKGSTLI